MKKIILLTTFFLTISIVNAGTGGKQCKLDTGKLDWNPFEATNINTACGTRFTIEGLPDIDVSLDIDFDICDTIREWESGVQDILDEYNDSIPDEDIDIVITDDDINGRFDEACLIMPAMCNLNDNGEDDPGDGTGQPPTTYPPIISEPAPTRDQCQENPILCPNSKVAKSINRLYCNMENRNDPLNDPSCVFPKPKVKSSLKKTLVVEPSKPKSKPKPKPKPQKNDKKPSWKDRYGDN